jgi:hypothetical protein
LDGWFIYGYLACDRIAPLSSLRDISSCWKTLEPEGILDFVQISSETFTLGFKNS